MRRHYYSIVFCILSALLLVWVVYQGVRESQELNQPLQDKVSIQKQNKVSEQLGFSYNISSISNSDFFKTIAKAKPKKVVAKKTSLKLKLEGIVSADNKEMSRAVIRSQQQKAISYEIGDSIKGTNAKLDSVEAYRVIINRAGVLESLELDRKKIEKTSLNEELDKS